jgi:hypothetical protein
MYTLYVTYNCTPYVRGVSPRCTIPYSGLTWFKFCPSLLKTFCHRAPARFIRDLSMYVCSSSKNCPYTRLSSAAYVVRGDDNVFGTKTVPLNHNL